MVDVSGGHKSRQRLLMALLGVVIAAAVLMMVAVVLLWQRAPGDEVVVKDNAIIYRERESSFSILASDENSVLVSSVDDIAEGDVICAGVSETTPEGLLRKVGRPEPVEGGFRIPTQQAALTDVIEQCDVRVTIVMSDDGGYSVEQSQVSSSPGFVDQAFADEGSLSIQGESAWVLFEDEGDGLSATAQQSLEVEVCIDQGKMFFKLVDSLGVQMTFNGIEFEPVSFEKPLKPIQFNIGPVPVVIMPSFEAEASLEGSAHGLGQSIGGGQGAELSSEASEGEGFGIAGKVEKSFGFEYTTDEGFAPIGEDRSQFPHPTIVPVFDNFGIDVVGEVSLSFKALLYGVSGVELSSGLAMQVSAELNALAPDHPSNGAIEIPGLTKRFAGTLSQKIIVPIRGSLVLEDLNVFDWELVAGCSLDLFDTDDAITLLDETKTFGAVGDSGAGDGSVGEGVSVDGVSEGSLHKDAGSGRVVCTTKVSDGVPPLFFVHPSDWDCHSEGNSETLDLILGPQSAMISIEPHAAETRSGRCTGYLQYLELGGGDMWIVFDPERTVSLTKVAGAALAAPGDASGSYVVAEAAYPAGRSDPPDNLHTELVLVPASFLERCPLSTIQDTNLIVFDFLDRAVSFSIDTEGLSEEERREAIQILASLRVAA